MVRTGGTQLEGFTMDFTSTLSFDLYTNKPQALMPPPEVTFSMISEYRGTEKRADGPGGGLSVDARSVVEAHQRA